MKTDLLEALSGLLEIIVESNVDLTDPRVFAARLAKARATGADIGPILAQIKEVCPCCENGEDPWEEKCENCDGRGTL